MIGKSRYEKKLKKKKKKKFDNMVTENLNTEDSKHEAAS